MSNSPKENVFREKFRKSIDNFVVKLPLPNINPDIFSYSTLITTIISVYFFTKNQIVLFLVFFFLTLLFDWIDGTIARKYHRATIHGWILDKVIDRISEIIFFSFIFPLGLVLVILEIFRKYLQYNGKCPYWLMFLLPLRETLFLIYLLITII